MYYIEKPEYTNSGFFYQKASKHTFYRIYMCFIDVF